MKKNLMTLSLVIWSMVAFNQINPLLSPYYQDGPYTVAMDSDMTATPNDLLFFRPSTSAGGPFPTILFQPGANGTGTSYINKHSYDIYWQHLASYGFVVIIINNTSGGPNSTLFTQTHDYIKTNVSNTSHWMYNYVDLNRFIVAGHSNGGMNATDIIIDRPNEIKAIIYMASYPNPGIFGLGAQNVTDYNGKVLLMCGSEDETSAPLVGTTNDVASTAFQSRFTSASCKTWVYFNGVGHGGFGDYNNPSQPVGTVGRDSATASIRHYICSFLFSQFSGGSVSFLNFSQISLRPSTVGEFETSCSEITGNNTTLLEKGIRVYPNPVCTFSTITFDNPYSGTCVVYDFTGKEIETINISDEVELSINFSEFKKGQYLLRFTDQDGVIQSIKVIKL